MSFVIAGLRYSPRPGDAVDIPDLHARCVADSGIQLTEGPAPSPAPLAAGVPIAAARPDPRNVTTQELTERQAAEILDGATIEDALNEGASLADLPPSADSDGTAASTIAALASQGIKLPGVTERRRGRK